MSFKRFGPNDLVYSTLVTKPEYSFIIHSSSLYKDNEILQDGDFSNKIKHIEDGQVSLYEMNINRPSNSLIHGFISKDTTRYAYRTISTSDFDDSSQFQYGNTLTQSYPFKANLTRIFVDAGAEYDVQNFENIDSPSFAADNKKYITVVKNLLNNREHFGQKSDYENLGTKKVNLVCIPGILYGSQVAEKSIELNYYVTGTLVATLQDTNGDGSLVETKGPNTGSVAGYVLYNQGLLVLTGSWDLSEGSHTDKFFSTSTLSEPNWLNFGTGLEVVGEAVEHDTILSSSYEVRFKGLNKIPTLTMMAFSEKNEQNYSLNPSFLETTDRRPEILQKSFIEPQVNIKNVTNSGFENYSASFESTTYISKVGIYDENKNLIAIATLANPIKKTPTRDYMIKMRMDF